MQYRAQPWKHSRCLTGLIDLPNQSCSSTRARLIELLTDLRSVRFPRGRHSMNGWLLFRSLSFRFVSASLVLSLTATIASAVSFVETSDKAAVIGQPITLQVQPKSLTLRGQHAYQQLIVTGHYAGGLIRDLTGVCAMQSESAEIAAVDETGLVTPKKNGQTAILVQAGGKTVRVPVTVTDFDKPYSTSFRNEVIAA